MPAPAQTIQRDWLAKSLAGVLLGATLALGCSAVFSRLVTSVPLPVKAQLAMWLTAPIWLVVMSSVFFFASGKRAWLWLGAANLVVFGLFFVLRRS